MSEQLAYTAEPDQTLLGWALILQSITPSAKKRSGHARLVKKVIASCSSCIYCKWVVFISSCWQAGTYFISYWKPSSLYLWHSSRTPNETKFPGVFIARSLPVCDEAALRWLSLRLHENCSVSQSREPDPNFRVGPYRLQYKRPRGAYIASDKALRRN